MKPTEITKSKGILLFSLLCSFILVMSFGATAAEKKEATVSGKEEINAVISCMGYGYKVKVLVNGTDLGFKGGMSESKRLFDTNNEMANQAPPEMRKKLFVLVNGKNTISVEYKKEGSNPHDNVELTLEVEGYPAPLFKLESKKPSGKVEKTIEIQGKAPADFKTVTVTD